MNSKKAIFIVGLSPRSGTNFLYNLLKLHPDVDKSYAKGEDFLLYNSQKLIEFVDDVNASQLDKWGNQKEPLYTAVGNGVLNFLSQETSKLKTHVVAKTPFPKNLKNFKALFPENAYLIILCRDGKDTIESYERSFKRGFNRTLDLIVKGASEIISFKEENKPESYTIHRYEDLVKNHKEEISTILKHCNLSIERYPFEEAANMGVIGSSSFKRKEEKVSWANEQPKDKSFDPTKRSENWSQWQHQRFAWVVKDKFRQLGYPKTNTKQNIFSTYRNTVCDMQIFLKKKKSTSKEILKYIISKDS